LILQLRFFRICTAASVGILLSAAGASLQGALSNPLADPYILGISSGAGLGAAIAVATSPPSVLFLTLPVFAIVGALLTTGLVVGGVRAVGHHSPAHFLMVGIAVNALFSALTLLMMVASGPKMNWVILWLMGDFSQAGAIQLLISATIAAIGMAVLMTHGSALDAMSLGDDTATSFGFNVRHTRFWVVGVASIMTAVAVSLGGIVGFVALIVPHIIRLIGPRSYRYLIVTSGIFGGLILVVCDSIARSLLPTAELPVGVITAMIGAPLFFYLLWSRRHVL